MSTLTGGNWNTKISECNWEHRSPDHEWQCSEAWHLIMLVLHNTLFQCINKTQNPTIFSHKVSVRFLAHVMPMWWKCLLCKGISSSCHLHNLVAVSLKEYCWGYNQGFEHYFVELRQNARYIWLFLCHLPFRLCTYICPEMQYKNISMAYQRDVTRDKYTYTNIACSQKTGMRVWYLNQNIKFNAVVFGVNCD